MKTDVTVIPAAPRTYVVPKVVASVAAAALGSAARTTQDESVSDLDLRLAQKLSIDGVINAEDAFTICHGTTAEGSSINSFQLRGAEVGKEWTGKIVDGIHKDIERVDNNTLRILDYDPDAFRYFGISDSDTPSTLRAVGRLSRETSAPEDAEVLVAAGEWATGTEVFQDQVITPINGPLLASAAGAFLSGLESVRLEERLPLGYLDEMPVLAAALPPAVTPAAPAAQPSTPEVPFPAPSGPNEFVYAIVNPVDTTAVMSVIMVTPGPQAYIRSGGKWVLDEPTLNTLLSSNPPPLVEVTGATEQNVIAQVDSSQAQQLNTDTATATATMGPALTAQTITPATPPKKKVTYTKGVKNLGSKGTSADTSSPNGTMPPRESSVTAAVTASALSQAYSVGLRLAAATAERDPDFSAIREQQIRRSVIQNAARLRDDLLSRVQLLENIIVPMTASAPHTLASHHRHRIAEVTRHYWMNNVGSTRIIWGVQLPDSEQAQSK
jgi:hypothetical protein